MGNCLRRDSSMVWADDDLGPMEVGKRNDDGDDDELGVSDMEEKRRLLAAGTAGGSLPLARSSSGREVKIKITRKELEELLARVDMQGVTLEHVLAQLMINGTDSDRPRPPADMLRQRSWRPALQSIPELN